MFDPSVVLFNLSGKVVTALAMFIGLLGMGVVKAMAFLPEAYLPIAEDVYVSLAFGLTAAGFYKFASRNDG